VTRLVLGMICTCLLPTVVMDGRVADLMADEVENNAPLYKRADMPVEQRADDLLKRMTLREKLLQICGFWPSDRLQTQVDVASFAQDFCRQKLSEGVGTIGPVNMPLEKDVLFRNTIQKFLREKTRLGIPVIFHDEGCHGVMKTEATSFPMPIGLACCWDEDLIEKIYNAVAAEMRARGGQQALTPILDVARDPRWGRIEETMGEDPFINARLGAAMVRGFQGGATGKIDGEHVMSTLKHFVGHGTPEGGLNRSPALCGTRELREVHLAPFEYVIKTARPAALMPSYNEVDGVPSHANRWLLSNVLRGEFGFAGLIVSDYEGVNRLRSPQCIAADTAAAGKLALEAGVQMELPNPSGFPQLERLVASGAVEGKLIDEAVRSVLTAKFKLGLFENPFADAEKARQVVHRAESRQLALQAARESIVMLKNEGGILPISPAKYPKIAVIGPNADIARLGGYSGTPLETVSILDGIRKKAAGRAEVLFAQGCVVVKNDKRNAFENWKLNDVKLATLEENRPLIDEARRTAAKADLVVLVLGDNECTCRESWAPNHLGDRASLDLPGSQMDLAKAVLDEGKPVVLYLMNGRPLLVGELKDRVKAIFEGWYMGQETGTAAADILFGDVSPSGKLTVSIPKMVGQLPCYYAKKSGAGEFNYLFGDDEPEFPFGYGQSYTTFSYADLRVKDESIPADGNTTISVDVTNTGPMGGDEIVQFYVRQEVASVTRPVKQLIGFRRIHLEPGEKMTVNLPLEAASLAIYDINMNRRTEPGTYRIMAGPSSKELSSVPLRVAEQ
jgi:beta-glucosidase